MYAISWLMDRFCPQDLTEQPPTRPNTPENDTETQATNTSTDITEAETVKQWPNIPFGD